jgi:flavin-dependent thymidylate synthase
MTQHKAMTEHEAHLIKCSHQNTVELIGHYGGDLTHAQSAWTSTVRDLDEAKLARLPKLLSMLAANGHETPFEKSSLHFLVTTDIASHIHILKHRIAVSVNGESARYKELKDDKYYIPQDWDSEEISEYVAHLETSLKKYHACLERLVSKGITRKRAKESARLYLPYGNQITADVMFNFRSFVHFLRLRYSLHAQVEIREIAQKMLEQVAGLNGNPYEHTLKAFGLVDENMKIRKPFE